MQAAHFRTNEQLASNNVQEKEPEPGWHLAVMGSRPGSVEGGSMGIHPWQEKERKLLPSELGHEG